MPSAPTHEPIPFPPRRILRRPRLALFLAGCDPAPPSVAPGAPPTPPEPPSAVSAPDSPAPTSPGPDDPRAAGRQIVARAFGVLSSNLLAAIGRTGPAGALEFCSVNVGPLTAGLAPSNRVEIRRVTHKPRNPANRATEAELLLLEDFRRGLAADAPTHPSW